MIIIVLGCMLVILSIFLFLMPKSRLARMFSRVTSNADESIAVRSHVIIPLSIGIVFILVGTMVWFLRVI